jgi:hypothetical protein
MAFENNSSMKATWASWMSRCPQSADYGWIGAFGMPRMLMLMLSDDEVSRGGGCTGEGRSEGFMASLTALVRGYSPFSQSIITRRHLKTSRSSSGFIIRISLRYWLCTDCLQSAESVRGAQQHPILHRRS